MSRHRIERFYTDHVHMYIMALREIEPLTEEDFTALTAEIEKGQTEEQEKAVTKALNAKEAPPTVW